MSLIITRYFPKTVVTLLHVIGCCSAVVASLSTCIFGLAVFKKTVLRHCVLDVIACCVS